MNPRLRLWLVFALLVLITSAILSGASWLVVRGSLPLWLAWPAAIFLLVAIQALVWVALDWQWVRPGSALAREIELRLHAKVDRPLELPRGHGLGRLPDAVATLLERLRASRDERDRALAEATARIAEQQSRLAAVLRNLGDGLIVCTVDRRILLFNDAALRLLGGVGELGLDRPLDGLIAREPIAHAFELLREKHARDGPARAAEAREEFVCATADGAKLLRCRMSLILGKDDTVGGFVLDFVDAGERLGRIEEREVRVARMIQELRGPLAALRAAAEVLDDPAELDPAERAAFLDILQRESAQLSEKVEALCRAADELGRGDWPMADLYSADLVRWVARRLRTGPEKLELTPVGPGLWLHGDGYHLTLLLERLVRRIAAAQKVAAFDLEVHRRDRRVELDLIWQGEPLAYGELEAWLDEPLDLQGGARLRDVLRRHDSEIWSEAHERPGFARLRLPLPAPERPQLGEVQTAAGPLPPRPEFYDFDLLERSRGRPPSQLDMPLSDLTYVVFDTETTGLDPAGGDRIIQIAAVRIVNRRLLTGETFDALVDPGRPIPKASTRFHGITDDMVRGRPPIEIVLPRFRAFVGDAVLVAHNAAFDMAFLRKEEERCGVRFDNPVLDTLLLSAVLHDHAPDHSLEAIAARFGITLVDRHQALGDAIGTAQLFLRMLDLLEAQGVKRLRDALALTEKAVALRKRQAEAFGPRSGGASVRVAG